MTTGTDLASAAPQRPFALPHDRWLTNDGAPAAHRVIEGTTTAVCGVGAAPVRAATTAPLCPACFA